ncbi:MAG TPA: hypothetical protein VJ783_31745 [Pirellulales bacterium]|nr:hypothetical protein [Pirellulales bacterium]
MSRNQQTLASAYPRLIAQLDDMRGRWRLLQLGDGLLRLLAVVAAAIAVAVMCDNLFWPGRTGRALLLAAVCLAALMAISAWLVRRWLEDRRDDYFAALVERRFPALQNRLMNGLQLGRGNDYGSPQMIEAIVNDAAAASAELDLAEALDRRPMRRAAGWLVASGVVLLLYAFSPRFANGFSRVFMPLADIPPYTATQIAAVTPGNARVLEGRAVTIEATLTGAVPATAQLLVGEGERPWKTLPMLASDRKRPERFRFILDEASESFDYYVAAGDGRSRQYHLDVVARPRVEKISVEITPPQYTERAAEVIEPSDGEIAALAGSAVRLTLTANKPLTSARLLLDAGEPVELTRAADERTWQTTLAICTEKAKPETLPPHRRVMAPARYQIELAATDGADLTDPLWHAITAIDDQPPNIAILQPGRDVQLKPAETVNIELVAKDDFSVGSVKLLYRVNDEKQPRELAAFTADNSNRTEFKESYAWKLAGGSFKAGDLLQYWAEAADRNDVTGPGTARSQVYSIFLKSPEQALARLEFQLDDYAQALEELIRLQSENRAQTASGVAFETLVVRETLIRTKTLALSRAIQRDAAPVASMVESLDELYAGLMADCIRLLEAGRDITDAQRASAQREQALPVEDDIVEQLKALLARLQRNEQARKALKKLEKTDQAAHTAIIDALSKLAGDLHGLLTEEKELAEKFERLPKKPVDEANEEAQEAMDNLEEFTGKWNQWAKGKVDELTKLPAGFVDDFGLREDVNSVFEEIEKAAQRAKAEKIEVALEDLGAGLGTKMLEDLEVWMLDAPDAAQWVLEEPLSNAGLKVPEMPLPDALEDMMGDLLQEADEFDEEADDITSAWGDNLNQAGWGVADGPISSFSAKGKTGNDLPNNMELSGRSGDGRRGKSSGQMVGDTSRGLAGRKTPARVGAERYEPGKLKEETPQDPNGATGGGKKAGAGRRGLQGGTPPDFVKDMQRLSEKQAAVRDKAEQVAQRLEAAGVTTTRLDESIELMKSAEADLRDLRYEDAAAKRRVALSQLKGALAQPDRATAAQISRARDLPAELRDELLQSADEAYPAGYESLLKNYFKSLSEAEK